MFVSIEQYNGAVLMRMGLPKSQKTMVDTLRLSA